jgi:parallel beta-helix repeat protein
MQRGLLRSALPVALFFLLTVMCCVPAMAGTITVCSSGCNYTSIQEAINHASDGDTINVMNGTYYELITIDKSLVIQGENPGGTIINGNYSGDVVTIVADEVVFSGFTVTAGTLVFDPQYIHFGIGALNTTNITVSQCTVTDCYTGILANWTIGFSVSENEVFGNVAQGVIFLTTDSGRVVSNSVHDNGFGFMSAWSENLVCTGNNLAHNQYDGLCLIDGVTSSSIEDNLIQDNCYLHFTDVGDFNQAGGYFEFVRNSVIRNNTFDHNGGLGIYISQMETSLLDGNVMEQNYAGFSYNDVNLDPGNTISLSNTVDGLPILYLEDAGDQEITGEQFSCIYLISCTNMTVRDLVVSDRNGLGITARGGSGIRAVENAVAGNVFQNILFAAVKDSEITGNGVTQGSYGIGIIDSVNVTVAGNTASGNDHGLAVALTCDNVHLLDNTVDDNGVGISLEYAVGDGTDAGISCRENMISGNASGQEGLGIYLMNAQGISAHHNEMRGLFEGVWIRGGEQNTLSHLSIENSTFGIEISPFTEGTGEFVPARDNVLTGNVVFARQKAFFTDMDDSYIYGNRVFLNSFSSDEDPSAALVDENDSHPMGEPVSWGLPRSETLARPAGASPEDTGEPNVFNTDTPVTYQYQDIYFTGYLGNYWNWYNGTDLDGNGVGTTPYSVITNNTDYYPLVAPVSAYGVGPAPAFYANFTASPVQGDAPLTVQFTDASNGTPVQWLYRFGNGVTSRTKNPRYTYRAPGIYTVSLTIWRMDGQTLVSTTTEKPAFITVGGGPGPVLTANFTAEPLSGSAPFEVTFTDTSTGNPQYWSFNFGDGSTSTAKNPVHTYRQPGNYTVTLTVSKLEGSTFVRNTTVQQDLITVGGGPEPVLTANFTAEPLSGSAPLEVTFTDISRGEPDFWSFNFGDGSTSTAKNPVHTYCQPGNYTVTLTVSKLEGSTFVRNTTVQQDLITVGGGPGPVLTANFTAEPLSGSAPLEVTFTDISRGEPDFWSYNFGDGSTSTAKNPVHTYRLPGIYTVNLTVTKLDGSTFIRNTIVNQDLITVVGGSG